MWRKFRKIVRETVASVESNAQFSLQVFMCENKCFILFTFWVLHVCVMNCGFFLMKISGNLLSRFIWGIMNLTSLTKTNLFYLIRNYTRCDY